MVDYQAICCGTATIAQRGQVVIPVKARKQLDLKPGDQLMVFAKEDAILAMIKVDKVEEFMNQVVQNFSSIKNMTSAKKKKDKN